MYLRHASVRSVACETIFIVFFNAISGVANMHYFNAQQLAVDHHEEKREINRELQDDCHLHGTRDPLTDLR